MDKIEKRPFICMTYIYICLLTFFIIILQGGSTTASNTATQTITFSIQAINEISVSSDPAAMTISLANAGSAPVSVMDTGTTYNITTNESSQKITGQITTGGEMPPGVMLEVNLTAPHRRFKRGLYDSINNCNRPCDINKRRSRG